MLVADCRCFVPTLPSDGGLVDTGLGGYGRYLDICVRTPETTIATPAVTSWRDSQNLAPDAADSDTTSSDQWPPWHWPATLGIFPAQKQFQNISDQIISYLQKVPRTVVGYIYTFKGSIDVKQIDGENTNIVFFALIVRMKCRIHWKWNFKVPVVCFCFCVYCLHCWY